MGLGDGQGRITERGSKEGLQRGFGKLLDVIYPLEVQYLDCAGSFMDIYICQSLPNHIL